MAECIFCQIVNHELPAHIVFEDDQMIAFLDIHPVNPGHVLIVPKEHSNNFLEMPDEGLVELMQKVKKLAPSVVVAVKAEACNIMINSGRAAGQLVYHTHVHVIPRFPADGHKHWQREGDELDNLPQIADKVRGALNS